MYRFAALRLACQQPAAMRRQSREELQMDRAAIDMGQPGKITIEPVAQWPALNSRRRKCFAICRASVGREQGEHWKTGEHWERGGQAMASSRPLSRAG